MQINLVNVEDGLIALGFRKMASFTKSINPNTKSFHVTLANYRSLSNTLRGTYGQAIEVADDVIREIAEPLAQADIVGFSSMTGYAALTKTIIQAVRTINPDAFIVWGGIHPIIHPEDAILSSDAICVGEGELAFKNFLDAYKDKSRDYSEIGNFWFNKNGNITRNNFLPLNTSEDMNQFPFLLYGEDEYIFVPGQGFVSLTLKDYLDHTGLAYNTIWSIGCPYICSYCGNTRFIENDKNYRKLRFPSVDYITGEVKSVLRKFPHISTVVFHDDSFMAITKTALREFAAKWRSEVQIPFCVSGVIPSFVQEEKMEILVQAGMNRLRMGVQSGSDRILEFYKRPNKPGLIKHATSIIAKFNDYMIPPAYDLITDNPIETKQDVLDSLELLYDLPRPFTLNVYALRVIPNTELERQLLAHNLTIEEISANYTHTAPTLANALIFLLTVLKPPKALFNFMLRFVRPSREKQVMTPLLLLCCRFLWLAKRAFYHVRFMDFSVIPGRLGWWLWKLGIMSCWRSWFIKTYPK